MTSMRVQPTPHVQNPGDGELLAAEALRFAAGESELIAADDLRFEQHVEAMLSLLGEEPGREGLRETPRRVRKAWREWTQGYAVDPALVVKSFVDGASPREELVLVRDIPVYSHCEHHLAPFFGVAHICYIPAGRIVGLSKLPRLVDVFARRLQVQERLTEQIAQALEDCLMPRGVGVTMHCRHLCMESRGIRSRGALTTTAAYCGQLKTDSKARAEFMERTR